MEILAPRVSKRERKLHLSYELPSRIHCSRIYPLPAPNGSTIILYGYDRGLRVLWRGGRRPKEPTKSAAKSTKTNGVDKDQDVIVLDDSDDESSHSQGADVEDQYEVEEEEQDPDRSYPRIIQDLDVDLGTEVLHVAIPAITPVGVLQLPKFASKHIIVVLGCTDGRILLMTVPLRPPTFTNKQDYFERHVQELRLEGVSGISEGIAVKILPKEDDHPSPDRSRPASNSDGRLLIAAVANGLNIWSLKTTPGSISSSPDSTLPMISSVIAGSAVALQSSSVQNLALIVDRAGAVRVYDPFATKKTVQRPPSRGSESIQPTDGGENGRWIMSFQAPFNSSKDNPVATHRKKILDAGWVLGGRAILVLLEDGQWGIWDFHGGSQGGKNVQDFSLQGYLGTSSSTADVAETGKQKKGGTKLAPMTPNTRKTKSENLFSGTQRAPGVASYGGISISNSGGRSGQADESVFIWYNGDIYSIQSMQAFWHRSTSNSGSGFGSLYAPGLTHISNINLMNENVTSISQFAPASGNTSLGQMNMQRDILVSAEHRLIILQGSKQSRDARSLFQQPIEEPIIEDQDMLDAGELDLGGMDRMLDNMAGGGGKTRKVGFAP